MTGEVAVLSPETTLAVAVATLLKNRVFAMPVVDADGKYLGQFRKNLLFSGVLPIGATTYMRLDRISRMIDIGLFRDSMHDVRTRFAAISQETVSQHLDTAAPVLRPDQPLVTAILYFYQGRNFLPVVDRDSGILVGEISAWDVLENLTKES